MHRRNLAKTRRQVVFYSLLGGKQGRPSIYQAVLCTGQCTESRRQSVAGDEKELPVLYCLLGSWDDKSKTCSRAASALEYLDRCSWCRRDGDLCSPLCRARLELELVEATVETLCSLLERSDNNIQYQELAGIVLAFCTLKQQLERSGGPCLAVVCGSQLLGAVWQSGVEV